MGKRIKRYLKYIEHVVEVYEKKYNEGKCEDVAEDSTFPEEDVPALDLVIEDLVTQIGYFQHERHMHLIVTIGFAIMTMMAFFFAISLANMGLFYVWLLPLAFLVLLVPYVIHYFHLENGVQKLYVFHDRLTFLKH